MSDELRGVVVCHAKLAGALVDAAEQISGVRGALVPVSNTDCDRGTLEQRVAQAVDGTPTVVFVDLSSGSCLFAVLNRLREAAGRQGRHRRESRDAGGFPLPPLSSARGGRGSRRRSRRQGDRDPLMPIVLCRVDDRLVHGQVVIGWGRPLSHRADRPGRRHGRGQPWEQDLYRMAVSPEIEVLFAGVADASPRLRRVAERLPSRADPHRRSPDHGGAPHGRAHRHASDQPRGDCIIGRGGASGCRTSI